MNDVSFFNEWFWLMAIGFGLLLIIIELLIGVYTGLDLVFIGTAFCLGGAITFAFHSFAWTAIVSGLICILYIFLGRRYIHYRTAIAPTITNIDTIIGKAGVVKTEIKPPADGLVKVGNEEWRARADELLKTGENITVTGIKGVTLTVKKLEKGGM